MGWRRLSSTSRTYFIIFEFRVGAPIAPTSHSCVYTAGEGKAPGSGKKHKKGSGFRGGQLTLEVLPLCPASTPLFRQSCAPGRDRGRCLRGGRCPGAGEQVFRTCLDRMCGSKFRAKDLETGRFIFRDFGLDLDE